MMAERRMFSKTVVESDSFLSLPATAQNLYFHLGMSADDEGFLNNAKKVQRLVLANEDDLKRLEEEEFIIRFESGVVAISHWNLNNYIQKDRKKRTIFEEEKSQLKRLENGMYTKCIQNGYKMDTQYSIDKFSLEKEKINKKEKAFKKPTLEQVSQYCQTRKNQVDPQRFLSYYDSNGWKVGRNSMKDWKAAVRTWERSGFQSFKNEKPLVYENQSYEVGL